MIRSMLISCLYKMRLNVKNLKKNIFVWSFGMTAKQKGQVKKNINSTANQDVQCARCHAKIEQYFMQITSFKLKLQKQARCNFETEKRYKDNKIMGYKDTKIMGYKDNKIMGYKDTKIMGYKDTKIM